MLLNYINCLFYGGSLKNNLARPKVIILTLEKTYQKFKINKNLKLIRILILF